MDNDIALLKTHALEVAAHLDAQAPAEPAPVEQEDGNGVLRRVQQLVADPAMSPVILGSAQDRLALQAVHAIKAKRDVMLEQLERVLDTPSNLPFVRPLPLLEKQLGHKTAKAREWIGQQLGAPDAFTTHPEWVTFRYLLAAETKNRAIVFGVCMLPPAAIAAETWTRADLLSKKNFVPLDEKHLTRLIGKELHDLSLTRAGGMTAVKLSTLVTHALSAPPPGFTGPPALPTTFTFPAADARFFVQKVANAHGPRRPPAAAVAGNANAAAAPIAAATPVTAWQKYVDKYQRGDGGHVDNGVFLVDRAPRKLFGAVLATQGLTLLSGSDRVRLSPFPSDCGHLSVPALWELAAALTEDPTREGWDTWHALLALMMAQFPPLAIAAPAYTLADTLPAPLRPEYTELIMERLHTDEQWAHRFMESIHDLAEACSFSEGLRLAKHPIVARAGAFFSGMLLIQRIGRITTVNVTPATAALGIRCALTDRPLRAGEEAYAVQGILSYPSKQECDEHARVDQFAFFVATHYVLSPAAQGPASREEAQDAMDVDAPLAPQARGKQRSHDEDEYEVPPKRRRAPVPAKPQTARVVLAEAPALAPPNPVAIATEAIYAVPELQARQLGIRVGPLLNGLRLIQPRAAFRDTVRTLAALPMADLMRTGGAAFALPLSRLVQFLLVPLPPADKPEKTAEHLALEAMFGESLPFDGPPAPERAEQHLRADAALAVLAFYDKVQRAPLAGTAMPANPLEELNRCFAQQESVLNISAEDLERLAAWVDVLFPV